MKKIFSAIILIFSIVVLSSCRLFGETTLVINPVEKYLTKNRITESEVSTQKLAIRRDAPDQIDYSFEVGSEELSSIGNPNNLITGSSPLLLVPKAKNYTIEETQKKFHPIVEMSSSGYGNKDIDATNYGQIQYRTCYAISDNGDGSLRSGYYNISIVIEDKESPTANSADLLVNSDISYKNVTANDPFTLINEINRNYYDNDPNTYLNVIFYDETYSTIKSAETVLLEMRSSKNLISENKIQPQMVYFVVVDGNGNRSTNDSAAIVLKDDVAPEIYKNGEKVEDYGNDFSQFCYDTPNFKDSIKTYFVENKYSIVDEVEGNIPVDTAIFKREHSVITIEVTDSKQNTEQKTISVPRKELIWFSDPSYETTNPERGLKYDFIIDAENNVSIRLLSPNIIKENNPIWHGTDGMDHIVIPKTINFGYGEEYEVTELANSFLAYIRLNKNTAIYTDGLKDVKEGTIDLTESNIVTYQSFSLRYTWLYDGDYYFNPKSIKLGNSEKTISYFGYTTIGWNNIELYGKIGYLSIHFTEHSSKIYLKNITEDEFKELSKNGIIESVWKLNENIFVNTEKSVANK